MGHPMEEPQQGGAFQRPANGDPLAVKLYRENEGDEEQSHAAKPSELRHPRRVGRGYLLQHQHEA